MQKNKKKNSAENRDLNVFSRFNTLGWRLFGSVLSGVLLMLSFPGYGVPSLAFVGLVPLFFAVYGTRPRRAAWLGWVSGAVFFLGSIGWMINLSIYVEGWGLKICAVGAYLILALYCALYFIPPAIILALFTSRWGIQSRIKNILLMVVVSVVWVGTEYLRGIAFTGFPWNELGISQYRNYSVIQVASWGGVHLISFILVWLNVAVFVTFGQYTAGLRSYKYRPHIELFVGLLPVTVAAAIGLQILFHRPALDAPIQVAMIQPNVAQVEKWSDEHTAEIYRKLEQLTDTAGRMIGVDLLIWPETALPDFIRCSDQSYGLVKKLTTKTGIPLLAGSMDYDFSGGEKHYFNSSILFDSRGFEVRKYDKQHLVPFGEYVPLPKLMRTFTPVSIDFSAGEKSTLFQLSDESAPFSVLICFEDTVAPLAVNAVRSGARWLVNQTNDAWFDPSAQSEQHMAHAIFRCIENRVPMARACNTGITCMIDRYGTVQRNVDVRSEGFFSGEIYPEPEDRTLSFYTRYGNIFGRSCVILTALLIAALRIQYRRRKSTAKIDVE